MAPKLKFTRSKQKNEDKPASKADLVIDAASVYSHRSARSQKSQLSRNSNESDDIVTVDKRIVAKQKVANSTYNYCYNSKHNHGYGGPTLLDIAMGEAAFPEMDIKKNQIQSGQPSSKGTGTTRSNLSKDASLRSAHRPPPVNGKDQGLGPPIEISFDYPGVGPPDYAIPDTISTKSLGSKQEHPGGKMPNVIQGVLESVYYDLLETKQGDVARHIPELAKANPDDFGIVICTASGGRLYKVGNTDTPLSIQSVAKPFSYALALSIYGEDHMRQKVGIQPGGTPGALNVDPESGRPFNPMVRSGSLATIAEVVDACDGNMERTEREICKFFSDMASRKKKERFKPDESVYVSEKNYSDETQRVLSALSSQGITNVDEETILELFFRQRSLNVTCTDLAVMGATLAANGVNPRSGVEVCPSEAAQLTLSLMSSCCMNKYPGQWMNDVGMPAVCGASGGVVAVAPGRLALAVYSPRLDKFGNPLRGVAACIELSRQLGVNLFLQEPKIQKMIESKQKLRSRKWRPAADVDCLEENKELLNIITSPSVVDYVFIEEASSILSTSNASFVILDLSNVIEVNPTSEVLLEELIRSITSSSTHLLICTSAGSRCFLCSPDQHPRVFWPIDEQGGPKYTGIHTHSLDAALEAAEDFILKVKREVAEDKVPSFFELLTGTGTSEDMLKKHFVEQKFSKGEVILKPGDTIENLYVIELGHYTAWKDNVRVTTYGPGTSFGELYFAGQEKKSHTTVVSETDGSCLVMSPDSFKKLRLRFPQSAVDLLLLLNRDLSHNLRHMSDQLVMMK